MKWNFLLLRNMNYIVIEFGYNITASTSTQTIKVHIFVPRNKRIRSTEIDRYGTGVVNLRRHFIERLRHLLTVWHMNDV